ncbi:MAG: NAD(P)H-hydrate dehydratase, partial [Acidobacteriota bacterium]|nr:NAD(P)H-hydrate dehydratase [Acidobacteriota bacterium]
WKDRAKAFDSDTVVLDGLLGTGLKDAVRGLLRTVIDDLNRIGPAMTSIDLPSGLDADSASVPGVALRVDRAYMLCRPKLCRYLRPAMTFATNWSLLPIGIPDEAVASVACRLRVNDPQSLPLRPTDSHKGVHGHLLLVAGSVGKSGAAVLAGRGALRGGVGLVTVACPEAVRPEIACQQAELMTLGLNAADRETLEQRATGFDAVALGPGLGLDDETVAWVRSLTGRLREPMVIDADGVNALARGGADPAWVATRPQAGTVLTPHPGEAARLLGWTTQQVQSDRLQALERLVEGWKVVVVLKGEHTLIGSPEGDVAVNITGNAGMATAGTGDVLTGLLGAFLARGIAPYEAACLAVQIHGDAGDRAAELLGQDGMIASDLVEMLPTSIQMRAES